MDETVIAEPDEMVIVESCGITVELDTERLADQRFAYLLSRATDKRVPDGQKLVFYGRMLALAFGGDDEAYEVMDRLADAGGGTLDAETFNQFFVDALEQAGAKNS